VLLLLMSRLLFRYLCSFFK